MKPVPPPRSYENELRKLSRWRHNETAVTTAETEDSSSELKTYDPMDAQLWCAGRVRRAAAQKGKFHSVPSIIVPTDKERCFSDDINNMNGIDCTLHRIESARSDGGCSTAAPSSCYGDCSTSASSNSSCSEKVTMRSITKCERISDFYLLGEDMAKYGHKAVHKARRISDGMEVVVKVREKCNFAEKENDGLVFEKVCMQQQQREADQEDQEWRRSAIMLLNLPKHETIAQLYEVLEDANAYYVVMEKVPGVDLYEALHSDVRITIEEARAILYRLLQAVQDLHEDGCIHKDLKLENVMLDSPILNRNPWESPDDTDDIHSNMAVKIIDFDTVEAFSPKMISKRVVGTNQYIPHEAYSGRYSPASDMFSVGVMAFRLISGRFPYWNMNFDDWPGENRAGSPKMREIQDRLKTFEVNYDMDPWPDHPLAKELVSWMMQTNEVERPTVEQALAHPFFEPVLNSPRSQKP